MSNNDKLGIEQTNIFKHEFRFEVFKKHYLRISKKIGKNKQEYTVDLISLMPEGSKVRYNAWGWLVASVSFFSLVLVFINILMSGPNMQSILLYVPLSLLSLFLAIGSGLIFYARSYTKQVYVTNFGQYPLVEILDNSPDKLECARFFRALEGRIRQVRDEYRTISVDRLKAGELKMLRRLLGKGVLTEKVYENIKQDIFGQSTQHEEKGRLLDDGLEEAG